MDSSSKSPSAHPREDLSPMDEMVEESVHNEVGLSKGEQNPYPYPEDLKVEELVPNVLAYPSFVEDSYIEWNKNYVGWRQKMLDVIENEGLLGFIDDTVQAPSKTVTTSFNGPKGGNTVHEERENEEYVAWKRSDDLVRKWILNRLEGLMSSALEFSGTMERQRRETAKELWERIAAVEQRYRLFHYLELYKAALKGDWDTADKIIRKEPDAMTARITVDSETALIVAVKMAGGKDFVERLVEKMSSEDVAIRDNQGRTALHRAAEFGKIEVAKLLVDKNRALPHMETHLKEPPLFYAAERGNRKMVEWLMDLTDRNKLIYDLNWGFRILYQLTHSQLYDIALKLLKRNPSLAYPNWAGEEDLKFHALATLAGTPSSFKSGNNFNFLQEFIYSSMKFWTKKNEGMELEKTADNHSGEDIESSPASNNSSASNGMESENNADNHSSAQIEAPPPSNNSGVANGMESENIANNHSSGDIEAPPVSSNSSVANGMGSENIADNHSSGDIEAPPANNNSGVANGGWAYAMKKKFHAIFSKVKKNLHAIFSKVIETLFDQILIIKPIREIREKKLLHNQALDLLKSLCEQAVEPSNYFEADRNFRLPLERATSTGIHEVVEEILRVYPYAIYLENYKKRSIFQQAIVFRQEKVFNLIYQHQESWAMVLSKGDDFNNNALHLAGYVAHPEQIYRRAGAALQMQRELQWFKEVERLVLPKNKEERNKEGKTPAQVFSHEHRELVNEGERWMKDTASSCTIIASLIATVVFSTAITIPGGNKPDGPPNFDQQPAFLIFSMFNALALFSSIASVVLFLSILTSRYVEEDFLVTLPKRLIIGLTCLLLSLCILFTMTPFGATLYLVFGKNKGWVLIPAGVLGCIPVTLFNAFQFPVLNDLIKSTYGSSIFYNKSDRIKTLKRS